MRRTTLLVVAMAVLSASLVRSSAPVALEGPALDAVVRAVRVRMGAGADVTADVAQVQLPASGGFDEAVVAPGGALGIPTRVWFRGPRAGVAGTVPAVVGTATLVLRVAVDHAHATAAIRHGATLRAADVATVRHVVEKGPLRQLPTAEEAVGARVLRDVPAGACLSPSMFMMPPAVLVGAEVEVVVRTGDVEVRGALVAVDSGRVGDRIRVMNPVSRRTMRGTVVARGRVEIGHD